MGKTIEVLDGKVFRPEGTVDLEPNRPYVLTIAEKERNPTGSNAWRILDCMTGTVDAPDYRAQEHDHYLYGVPIRNKKKSWHQAGSDQSYN